MNVELKKKADEWWIRTSLTAAIDDDFKALLIDAYVSGMQEILLNGIKLEKMKSSKHEYHKIDDRGYCVECEERIEWEDFPQYVSGYNQAIQDIEFELEKRHG